MTEMNLFFIEPELTIDASKRQNASYVRKEFEVEGAWWRLI